MTIDERVEAVETTIPDVPDERSLMEQIAVLDEEAVPKPVFESFALVARFSQQSSELGNTPFRSICTRE